MANMKLFYRIFDIFFVSIWGLTIVDLIKITTKSETLLNIDNTIKTIMAIVGALYFLIQIPHKIKMQKLERELKEEQIEKIKRENEKDK